MLRIASIVLFSLIWLSCSYADQKLKGFQKVIFHTSECFGSCPIYHLEVDKDKNVKLHAEEVFKVSDGQPFEVDSSKIGYFTGKLDDSTFSRLAYLLTSKGLDTLTYAGGNCCDGSVKTIVIYKDNERKQLEAMDPVDQVQPIVSMLLEVCKSESLQPTLEKFKIEENKGSR